MGFYIQRKKARASIKLPIWCTFQQTRLHLIHTNVPSDLWRGESLIVFKECNLWLNPINPNTKKQFPQRFLQTFLKALITILLVSFFFLYDKYKDKLDVTVVVYENEVYRPLPLGLTELNLYSKATPIFFLRKCNKIQDIDARGDGAGTVPMIWSSCTRYMMHKFKPAEFHAAACCGSKSCP